MHVLLVGGDPCPVREVAASLRSTGYRVEVADGTEDGLWMATEAAFDALIVAGDDAAELCSAIRAARVWTPILVLEPICDGRCIRALDAGADDCETTPLRPLELEARLRALVRRGQPARPSVLSAGSLRLDPGTREVRAGTLPLPIVGLAFDLLELLLRREGEVATRVEIAECLWDWAWEMHSNTLDVHIHHLRSILRSAPGAPTIETVRGIGYRLHADPPTPDSPSLHALRPRMPASDAATASQTNGGDVHEALGSDPGDGGDHRVRRPGVGEPRDLRGHPA